uniref:Uncharacterized protein n=1 Tax=Equus asinus TaxID=9793 RepID=A0A8C4MBV2_EQUAS
MCGRQADIRHLPRGVRTGARAVRTAGPAAPPEWRDPDEHCPSYSKSPGWNSPELLPHCIFGVVTGSLIVFIVFIVFTLRYWSEQ